MYQKKAYRALSGLEKYANTDRLAKIAMNLSKLQDKANQTADALKSLRIVERICTNLYTGDHAKTCKVKRDIALHCLKAGQNDDALAELHQVETLERALYGESSTQLGKTFQVIGTLHLLKNNHI